jgi:NADH:ubiquinone oxidoreductase subunit K
LLAIGLLLFFIGLVQCLTSKKLLGFLLGIEVILNAANLNLLGFLLIQPFRTDIQVYMVFFIAFAVLETVAGLSLFGWIAREEKAGEFSVL